MKKTLVALAAVALVASGFSYPSTPRFSYETLRPLAGSTAIGTSINAHGLVAGTSTTSGTAKHATVWRNGKARSLGTLGGPGSSSAVLWPSSGRVIAGITQTDKPDPNNESWSCGFFLPARPGYACVGFAYVDGKMQALPTLGGPNGFAAGAQLARPRRGMGRGERTGLVVRRDAGAAVPRCRVGRTDSAATGAAAFAR